MQEGPLENLERVESKFRFVHVAARRARQLMGGMPAMLESTSRKPTRIAEEEVLRGLIEYETFAVVKKIY
jgi:DNA-directed RNA polymerase subunit omega